MGRIRRTFDRLRTIHERALIPYVTAGDPDMETTKALVREMARRGGDIIEIGVPFSDPLADGPIVQRASQRALQGGTTMRKILHMVGELRSDVDAPLVLMTYYNPVFRYGEAAFVADALAAGVDGLIIPDLPPEEANTLIDLTSETSLELIFLVAPTSTPERMASIAAASRGFIYYVSRLGTTGVRDRLSDDLRSMLAQLRSVTSKPIAVGFGVSTPEHVRLVAEMADGVVVASAILKLIEDLPDRSKVLEQVGDFVAELKAATRLTPIAARPSAS
ncbi:MAG TPA: tryptophan synthase subunit alpha [Alphaproteobacteria bacterium]|nr:tryptophan synthase subunit alpha [Alphaproteobacteria bacterium]